MSKEGPNDWPEPEERADIPSDPDINYTPNSTCGHSEADGRYWRKHPDGTVTNEAPNLHPDSPDPEL